MTALRSIYEVVQNSLRGCLSIVGVFIIVASLFGNGQERTIDDNEITAAIEKLLSVDEAISAHLIDIETNDGIVKIDGSVDNILAKERTAIIAGSIKGVRSVINAVRVNPVFQPDDALQNNIRDALKANPIIDASKINMEIRNGVVTLSGTTDTWAKREFAEEEVKRIKGINSVKNGILVEYKEQRTDEEMRREIEQRIELDPLVYGALTTVILENGKVILSGSVGSYAEKKRIYRTSWVPGVKDVDDDKLLVNWNLYHDLRRKSTILLRSNEEIEKTVRSALAYDPRINSSQITVDADKGIVALSGTVASLREKRAAQNDAQNTIGVLFVNNNIKVRDGREMSDKLIAEQVSNALALHPAIERHEIAIQVRNHKVYLYGAVDSPFERACAGDISSRSPGVVDVKNHLTIVPSQDYVSDEMIKKNIELQFALSLFVDHTIVSVEVKDGIAVLKGTIDTWQEYHAAIQNSFEGGAHKVRSYLSIRGMPEFCVEYDYPYYYQWKY